MKNIMYAILLVVSMIFTSCDKENNTQEDYNLRFACFDEEIDALQIDVLDKYGDVIQTQKYINVVEDEFLYFRFPEGDKVVVKVTDEYSFKTNIRITRGFETIVEDFQFYGNSYNVITLQL